MLGGIASYRLSKEAEVVLCSGLLSFLGVAAEFGQSNGSKYTQNCYDNHQFYQRKTFDPREPRDIISFNHKSY